MKNLTGSDKERKGYCGSQKQESSRERMAWWPSIAARVRNLSTGNLVPSCSGSVVVPFIRVLTYNYTIIICGSTYA